MSFPEQVSRWMSLREPQRESLARFHTIVETVEFRSARLRTVAELAVSRCGVAGMELETELPSFCLALATDVGQTRLKGPYIYDLWRTRGYRNFFILAPRSTIYEKLRM